MEQEEFLDVVGVLEIWRYLAVKDYLCPCCATTIVFVGSDNRGFVFACETLHQVSVLTADDVERISGPSQIHKQGTFGVVAVEAFWASFPVATLAVFNHYSAVNADLCRSGA